MEVEATREERRVGRETRGGKELSVATEDRASRDEARAAFPMEGVRATARLHELPLYAHCVRYE